MLVQLIWWVGIALECLLLVRGLLGKWAARHRIFYLYVLFVLSQSVLRFVTLHQSHRLYFRVYWITEFLGVIVGSAIVFEIYKLGLAAYPGVARMARNSLFFIFILAFTKACVDASSDPQWWPVASIVDLERYARIVQAFAIGALVLLFAIYAVPFGRNLRGIIVGYGVYVTASIVTLKFAAAETGPFADFWHFLVPVSYLFTLILWTVHLWSFQPQPAPAAATRLEHDYQKAAAATRRRLQEARGYLGKATQP